ncbi:MAG: nitrogenase iron protein, partial [Eubacteriaceae bacterium]|nr:nitrogenase iron protein [Eubacteriaceae bacterium]
ISYAVKSFATRGYAALRGLIFNSKDIEGEEELVDKAAAEIETQVIYRLPRDSQVQAAEALGKTVIDAFPESDMAGRYRELAQKIVEGTQ